VKQSLCENHKTIVGLQIIFHEKNLHHFYPKSIMESTPQLSVYPVESGPVATFGYMITDTAKGENGKGVAAVIDVPMESAEYFLEIAEQENVTIESIFLTHSHWDHTGDAAKLQRELPESVLNELELFLFGLGAPESLEEEKND
jgi:glyoxylase-like metal-dependent hydrolase (beta-lactamase superfamily II)